MAPERPRPDLDHTRDALREHDARQDSEADEADEAEDATPEEGEEQEPDRS